MWQRYTKKPRVSLWHAIVYSTLTDINLLGLLVTILRMVTCQYGMGDKRQCKTPPDPK